MATTPIYSNPTGSPQYCLPDTLQNTLKSKNRPLRIEILECAGGKGHKAAADAIQNVMKTHFDNQKIETHFKRKDIGNHMSPNPLGKVTFGKHNMIDLYNYLLKHGKVNLISAMVSIGKIAQTFFLSQNIKYFKNRYDKKIKNEEAPDLIISAVPMVNGPLITSLRGKEIPVMVVTTDLDNEYFSLNWPNKKDLPPYKYCIAYNSFEIAQKVHRLVNPMNIRGIGYPTRPEFQIEYTQDNLKQFRQELGIDPEKKVVGIMMGGVGALVTQKYFKTLLQGIKEGTVKDLNTHFSIFCGSNDQMKSTLINKAAKKGFKLDHKFEGEGTRLVHYVDGKESGITFLILGPTDKVHKHMALANCWITKSGSSSFNECLSMGVPMLIENTNRPIPWEELNIEMVDTYSFGNRVKNLDHFLDQLNNILDPVNNKKYQDAIREYRNDRPQQKCFGKNIVKLTYELLNEAASAKKEKVKIEEEKQNVANQKTDQATSHPIKPLTVKEKIKEICRKVAIIAKKVYDFVVKMLLIPINLIIWAVKKITRILINFAFFSGFDASTSLKKKRRKDILKGIRTNNLGEIVYSSHKAKPIEGIETPIFSTATNRPIDSIYIKSNAAKCTGNVVVYVLGKDYQSFHPRNYDHLLDDGADIVLFNPSEKSAKAMAADLKTVLGVLRERNPSQKVTLSGFCIGAHVATSVACDLAAESGISLPVIVDRGYGDGYELAKKISCIAKVPYVRDYVNKFYNNHTLEKIDKHKGAMLFLSPKDGDDQLLHQKLKSKKIKNFTKELHKNHKNDDDTFVELENADHWTPWTYQVHNSVKEFLKKQNIIQEDYKKFTDQDSGGFPKTTSVPWYRKKLLPLFI